MILASFTTLCLVLVIASCALHLNSAPSVSSHCEKIGFTVLAGGCAAGIWECWRPGDQVYAVPVLAIGMALVAISMDRDRVRALLSRTIKRPAYTGQERRKA